MVKEIESTSWLTVLISSTWITGWSCLDALDVCWEVVGGCIKMAKFAGDVCGIGVVVDDFDGGCVKLADTGDDCNGIDVTINGFCVGFGASPIDSIREKKISIVWSELKNKKTINFTVD